MVFRALRFKVSWGFRASRLQGLRFSGLGA